MIILKILLYIILAVLGLILIVLILPAGGEFSYIDGKLRYKVKLSILSIMDSEGGGVLGWLKKRKAKPKKPKKPKEPKPAKEKKSKKKKKSRREPYEWETELDDIPVNIPDEAAPGEAAQAAETAAAAAGADSAAEEEQSSDGAAADSAGNEKKKKKEKDKKQQDEPSDDEDDGGEEPEESKKKKKSLDELIELVIGIWESAQRPLLKIFKGFKLKDLYIDFVIADEDAYDCALKYGKYSALIYNGIAFFSQVFTVRLRTVDIRPAFGQSKGRWDAAGKLYFRLGTVVIAGLWFLITYIFRTFIPDKLRKRKLKKKSAVRQK